MKQLLFVIFLWIRFLVVSFSVVFFWFISSVRFIFLSVFSPVFISIVSSILLFSFSVISSSSVLILIFFSFCSSLSILPIISFWSILSLIFFLSFVSFWSISLFVPIISPCLSIVISVLCLFGLLISLSSLSVLPRLSIFPLPCFLLSSVSISGFSFFFVFIFLSLLILNDSSLVIKYPSIGLVISSALKASLKPTEFLSFSVGYLVSVILKMEWSLACPSVSLLSANSMYCSFSSSMIRQRPATFLWKMLARARVLQKLFITHIMPTLLNLVLPNRARVISLNKIALSLLSLSLLLVLNSTLSQSKQPVQGVFFCSAVYLTGSLEGAYCLISLASSVGRVDCQG